MLRESDVDTHAAGTDGRVAAGHPAARTLGNVDVLREQDRQRHAVGTVSTFSIATLEAVVDFYDRGGNANPFRDRELRPLKLTEDEKTALVAFLRSLTGTVSDGR